MARTAGGGTKFTIKGVKGIEKALRELPGAVSKKVVRQSIRKSLKPVAAAVRAEAPEDTGALSRAVKVRAAKGRKKNVIRLEVRVGKGDFVGDQFYAAFQQFGTGHLEANDFMTRGFEQTGAAAKAEGERLIRDGILREAKALKSSGGD